MHRLIPRPFTLKTQAKLLEFKQEPTETLGQAWEILRLVLQKILVGGIDLVIQLQHFYGGLDHYNKGQFDVVFGESIWTKATHEIVVLLEKTSNNDHTKGRIREPKVVTERMIVTKQESVFDEDNSKKSEE